MKAANDPQYKEKLLEKAKERYRKNPQTQIQSVLKWQKNNRDKVNKTKREYHARNKDKINAQVRERRKKKKMEQSQLVL